MGHSQQNLERQKQPVELGLEARGGLVVELCSRLVVL